MKSECCICFFETFLYGECVSNEKNNGKSQIFFPMAGRRVNCEESIFFYSGWVDTITQSIVYLFDVWIRTGYVSFVPLPPPIAQYIDSPTTREWVDFEYHPDETINREIDSQPQIAGLLVYTSREATTLRGCITNS